MQKKFLPFLALLITQMAVGQYKQPDAAAIQLKLKKLNVLVSVLYVAAHPDDENTRAITFMGNDRLAVCQHTAKDLVSTYRDCAICRISCINFNLNHLT